jgi:ribosomal protein S27AE
MALDIDFSFEKFEEYYGDADQVKKIIDECNSCGAKMVQTHLSDYKNLLVQETARCPECGQGSRKLIHIIN